MDHFICPQCQQQNSFPLLETKFTARSEHYPDKDFWSVYAAVRCGSCGWAGSILWKQTQVHCPDDGGQRHAGQATGAAEQPQFSG
jgi:hypothetical protein